MAEYTVRRPPIAARGLRRFRIYLVETDRDYVLYSNSDRFLTTLF
jgi:hypothetical protein